VLKIVGMGEATRGLERSVTVIVIDIDITNQDSTSVGVEEWWLRQHAVIRMGYGHVLEGVPGNPPKASCEPQASSMASPTASRRSQ
jgi:hypothetical protein